MKGMKAWVKSTVQRKGYVKTKCYNAGKITVGHFEELQYEFLADIKAEVSMNDIPPPLIFNWDQTELQFAPTGKWTMHQAREEIIPIASSHDNDPQIIKRT